MEKIERNKLIIKLYREGRLYKDIFAELRKEGYEDLKNLASLKGTIQRFKKRGLLPTTRRQLSGEKKKLFPKATKKGISVVAKVKKEKGIEEEGYVKVGYYLTEKIKREISLLAILRGTDRSALVREILTVYLKKQKDLPVITSETKKNRS